MADDHETTAPTIKPREDGPYRVDGLRLLLGADGGRIRVEGRGKGNIALCRCGASETKPFCDGTHRSVGFRSSLKGAESAAKVAGSVGDGSDAGTTGDDMARGKRAKVVDTDDLGAEPVIRITAGGPYVVTGNIELLARDRPARRARGRYALCRCGHSGRKPFCDGTHARVGFDDPGLDTTIDGED